VLLPPAPPSEGVPPGDIQNRLTGVREEVSKGWGGQEEQVAIVVGRYGDCSLWGFLARTRWGPEEQLPGVQEGEVGCIEGIGRGGDTWVSVSLCDTGVLLAGSSGCRGGGGVHCRQRWIRVRACRRRPGVSRHGRGSRPPLLGCPASSLSLQSQTPPFPSYELGLQQRRRNRPQSPREAPWVGEGIGSRATDGAPSAGITAAHRSGEGTACVQRRRSGFRRCLLAVFEAGLFEKAEGSASPGRGRRQWHHYHRLVIWWRGLAAVAALTPQGLRPGNGAPP
jgi:hypothetical protein